MRGYRDASFPLPFSGALIVTPAPALPAAPASGAKAWLQQQSIVSGFANWKVLLAGAGALWLLRGKS